MLSTSLAVARGGIVARLLQAIAHAPMFLCPTAAPSLAAAARLAPRRGAAHDTRNIKFRAPAGASPLFREDDVSEQFVRGGGRGGQSVAKTSNCVVLLHRPTGISVRCHKTRSRDLNRKAARLELHLRLDDLARGAGSVRGLRAAKAIKRKRKAHSRATAHAHRAAAAAGRGVPGGHAVAVARGAALVRAGGALQPLQRRHAALRLLRAWRPRLWWRGIARQPPSPLSWFWRGAVRPRSTRRLL